MGKHTTGGACRAQNAGERAERARATIIHYSPMAGARSQNADWTRPGPPPPAGPCARRPPPAPAQPGAHPPAAGRCLGRSAGARSAAAWGHARLHFPLVPPSPCQPGFRMFVFTSKRNDTKVENGSDEQTKEGEGLGNKVVCRPQQITRSRQRKKIFGQSVQKHCLSQELRNFSEWWPPCLDLGPSA